MRHLTSFGGVVSTAFVFVVGCGGGSGLPKADADLDAATVPVDGSAGDDGGVATPDGDSDGLPLRGHCPVAPDVKGPPMARVAWNDGIAFCIDSTEVTNADYAAFLAANVVVSTQGERCTWNASFTPETKATNGPPCPLFDPVNRAAYPVVCVDWCDADAYCRWAGKHLCQKPGGSPVTSITAKNGSEWVIACTGDGARSYPYGNTVMPGVCVDKQYPATTPALRPVMEASSCVGGVAGLSDMSGNAWEWQDDCELDKNSSGTGGDDICPPLGGAFADEPSNTMCTTSAMFLRKQVAGDTGFRCCADAEFF